MSNKKNTKEKGITLIALVITIIIMLILVAITINIVVNGGLIGYAQNARAETEEEINKENAMLSNKELDEIVANLQAGVNFADAFKKGKTVSEEEKINYPQIGDTVLVNFGGSESNIRDTDMAEEMVDYTTKGNSNTDVLLLALDQAAGENEDVLLSISPDESGTESEQTKLKYMFSGVGEFIILGIDETTGEMMLIRRKLQSNLAPQSNQNVLSLLSKYDVDKDVNVELVASGLSISEKMKRQSDQISLKGAKGYLNARTILDKVANYKYSNEYTSKVRNLRLEDIEGYLGQGTKIENSVTQELPLYVPSEVAAGNVETTSDIPEDTYLEYSQDNFTGNNSLKDVIFGSGYLGTTSVKYEDDGKVGFYITCVEDGKVTGKRLFLSDNTEEEVTMNIFPVFYMKADTIVRKTTNEQGENYWHIGDIILNETNDDMSGQANQGVL